MNDFSDRRLVGAEGLIELDKVKDQEAGQSVRIFEVRIVPDLFFRRTRLTNSTDKEPRLGDHVTPLGERMSPIRCLPMVLEPVHVPMTDGRPGVEITVGAELFHLIHHLKPFNSAPTP